ncbi:MULTISPECIES: class I fructose-bisphosphate aldolase [Haloferax]|uniref:fructose-bisphosphate aldolase n=2 Tax=Haloferax TaxID=2251 RepID=A0A6G1Z5R5_9EURY|nr:MULTISPECIES: fructose-1,6-bisphosphate aldolase [Haloferax]KAB1185340.1 fructose-1,6-bisphosphate aldolase [Haloferax sp. CBA1149]MRW81977.1 fructose-1,6-bisphosphate aldolase [Haloferax marinisediminis]
MNSPKLLDTPSGNAVVVALDHGLSLGAPAGFENPEETLETVLRGEPDAVLVGPHFARHYAEQLQAADVDIILTADVVTWSTSPGRDHGQDLWTPAFDTEFLKELDPVGVKIVLVFGRDDAETFRRNVEYVSELAEELRGTDIPLVVEPVMWGERIPDQLETDPEFVADALRMGWEFGADILKAPYTGSVESFEPIVENAPVPVMILGGPATGTTRGMLESVEGAMDAGARGLMIGRTIWKSEDPEQTVRALMSIVHDGASVDEVWESTESTPMPDGGEN